MNFDQSKEKLSFNSKSHKSNFKLSIAYTEEFAKFIIGRLPLLLRMLNNTVFPELYGPTIAILECNSYCCSRRKSMYSLLRLGDSFISFGEENSSLNFAIVLSIEGPT